MSIKRIMAAALMTATAIAVWADRQPVDYVDPFIGTTNFSVCNPGAIRPHGLMSVVPFNVMGSDLNVYDRTRGGGRRHTSRKISSLQALHT